MGRRIIAAAVFLILVVAACSDDPAQSYFDSVADATSTYVDEIAALPVASTTSSIEEIQEHFTGVDESIKRAASALDELTVPESIGDAHPEFVSSVERFGRIAERAALRTDHIETDQDLLNFANDPLIGVRHYNTVEAEMIAACLELQAVADESDVTIDLMCAALAGVAGVPDDSPDA